MSVKYQDRNIAQRQYTTAPLNYVVMVIVLGLPIVGSDLAIYLDVIAMMDAYRDQPNSHSNVDLVMWRLLHDLTIFFHCKLPFKSGEILSKWIKATNNRQYIDVKCLLLKVFFSEYLRLSKPNQCFLLAQVVGVILS